jgi:hypothetical protein
MKLLVMQFSIESGLGDAVVSNSAVAIADRVCVQ